MRIQGFYWSIVMCGSMAKAKAKQFSVSVKEIFLRGVMLKGWGGVEVDLVAEIMTPEVDFGRFKPRVQPIPVPSTLPHPGLIKLPYVTLNSSQVQDTAIHDRTVEHRLQSGHQIKPFPNPLLD